MKTKFDNPFELKAFWLNTHPFETIKFSKEPNTANSFYFLRYNQVTGSYTRIWFNSLFRPCYEGKVIKVQNEMFLVEFPEDVSMIPVFTLI